MQPNLVKLDVQIRRLRGSVLTSLIVAAELLPELCHASVESSLMGIQSRLTRVILPVCSMIGIGWAGISFLTGNERAKTHIWYAIIGSALGFGAQSLVNFISETVH